MIKDDKFDFNGLLSSKELCDYCKKLINVKENLDQRSDLCTILV